MKKNDNNFLNIVVLFLILCYFFFIAGCRTTSKIVLDENIDIKRTPPAESMLQCKKINELTDDSFSSVVLKLSEYIEAYKICENKRSELSEYIESEPVKK